MSREDILERLSRSLPEVQRQFGVEWLALFGSVARGEAVPGSDIDILVAFTRPPGLDGYMDLKWHLEDVLGTAVDLVMVGALRPGARRIVEAEAVRVA